MIRFLISLALLCSIYFIYDLFDKTSNKLELITSVAVLISSLGTFGIFISIYQNRKHRIKQIAPKLILETTDKITINRDQSEPPKSILRIRNVSDNIAFEVTINMYFDYEGLISAFNPEIRALYQIDKQNLYFKWEGENEVRVWSYSNPVRKFSYLLNSKKYIYSINIPQVYMMLLKDYLLSQYKLIDNFVFNKFHKDIIIPIYLEIDFSDSDGNYISETYSISPNIYTLSSDSSKELQSLDMQFKCKKSAGTPKNVKQQFKALNTH